jgi:hypothetical protein
MAVRAAVPDIDRVEAEEDTLSGAVIGMVPLMIPEPAYRALSDAAARRQLTVAQLLSEAIAIAIGKVGNHG